MAKPLESIDITDKPDLVDVAEAVRATDEPHMLRRGDEAVAIIAPITSIHLRLPKAPAKRRMKKMTEADIEASFSAAGSWADVDTDTLIANIYADRENSNRPSPEL